MSDNLTCDICSYVHPRPDNDGIVIPCADGVIRCRVCRKDLHESEEEIDRQVEEERALRERVDQEFDDLLIDLGN